MDKDGGMSIDEFANVIGELHQAKQDAIASVMVRIQQEAREHALSEDTPMTASETHEVISLWEWGCMCCICTLCLSWVPLFLKMQQVESELVERKIKEESMKHAMIHARNKLLAGPSKTQDHTHAELVLSRGSAEEFTHGAHDEGDKI